jgi:methylmalonyl-CoA/ethylmalonyl-CoA epimerase
MEDRIRRKKMEVSAIDHICFAVKNLSQAKQLYEEILGLSLAHEYVAESEKIKVARYYIGNVALELMESTSGEGEVAKFINKRGEGVFLISYRTSNVETGIRELKKKGKHLIDEKPRELFGNRYAFLMHPRETCGVLTEILDGTYQNTSEGD